MQQGREVLDRFDPLQPRRHVSDVPDMIRVEECFGKRPIGPVPELFENRPHSVFVGFRQGFFPSYP
jgi:hypothetical protein